MPSELTNLFLQKKEEKEREHINNVFSQVHVLYSEMYEQIMFTVLLINMYMYM